MSENQSKNQLRSALLLTGILIAAMALYAGSYLAIVIPQRVTNHAMAVVNNRVVEATSTTVLAQYSIGGSIAEWLFWPAHKLDRKIRKETWEE